MMDNYLKMRRHGTFSWIGRLVGGTSCRRRLIKTLFFATVVSAKMHRVTITWAAAATATGLVGRYSFVTLVVNRIVRHATAAVAIVLVVVVVLLTMIVVVGVAAAAASTETATALVIIVVAMILLTVIVLIIVVLVVVLAVLMILITAVVAPIVVLAVLPLRCDIVATDVTRDQRVLGRGISHVKETLGSIAKLLTKHALR